MASLIQRAFAGGEIGPELYARCDEVKYETGLRTMRNMMIMKHGGASNRPGTQFIGEVQDSTQPVRLIPFEFDDEQTYVLEFGNQYFRIIKNDAYLGTFSTPLVITGIAMVSGKCVCTVANPIIIGPITIQGVQGLTVNGLSQINGRNLIAANPTLTTIELQYPDATVFDISTFTAYVSGGELNIPQEYFVDYVVADLPMLKFVQSADVLTITHNSYLIATISRISDFDWLYNYVSIGAIAIPPTTYSASIGAGGNAIDTDYCVTAVSASTFEESGAGPSITLAAQSTPLVPAGIVITAIANVVQYNVYKRTTSLTTFGYIGSCLQPSGGAGSATSFVDGGILPDISQSPPTFHDPFLTSLGGPPAACAYIQQRAVYANQVSNTEVINMSQTGRYNNFSVHLPAVASDAVQFNMVGRKVNAVNHIVDLGAMVIFTATGEWAVNINNEGPISPGNVVPVQQSYFGSNQLRPIVIGQNALYCQARGSIIRDLGYQFSTQGYQGDDLTVFSPHLFQNFNMVDWDYQQIPNSIVWVVRDDGTLLGLTYIKEQQIWGWHRHDFQNNFQNGFVENVCCIPDGEEDSIFLVIRRVVNGVTKRYVEKLTTRSIDNVIDNVFSDATLSYDGRNDSGVTITPTTSGGWTDGDVITLTASAPEFLSTDVGNSGINMTGPDGTVVRYSINGFTSSTIVTAMPNRDVPADQQVALTTWAKTTKWIGGLWHLEGLTVSIVGDGMVVGSPNNSSYTTQFVVTDGMVKLDRAYAVVHVGLPYISDMETLDVDSPSQAALSVYKKRIDQVAAYVQQSRGFFAGMMAPEEDPNNKTFPPTAIDPLKNLYEFKARNLEYYDDPVALATEMIKVNIGTGYTANGRVFVRQVDPIPLTVLSIVPSGDVPTGGK